MTTKTNYGHAELSHMQELINKADLTEYIWALTEEVLRQGQGWCSLRNSLSSLLQNSANWTHALK